MPSFAGNLKEGVVSKPGTAVVARTGQTVQTVKVPRPYFQPHAPPPRHTGFTHNLSSVPDRLH